VRKILWTIFGLWLCGALVAISAETYQLTDGSSLAGDIVSFNDDGIIFRTGDKYSDRVPWTKFSQDALKKLAQNPKIEPFADPFIETPPAALLHKKEVTIHKVSRLEFPPKQSLIGAVFSSSVSLVALLFIYAANIYAAFEIAIYRARPMAVVIGTAALLPILGPVIFLSLPRPAPAAAPIDSQPEVTAQSFVLPGTPPAPEAQQPAEAGGLHVTATKWQAVSSGHPEPQIFQRGQFTFNRRFFETKFAAFFSVMRHGADKDMVLLIKTPRAQHIVERVTRIAANEAYFEVARGAARQEIMVPFAEIQEIQLKHKDA
jgi:hypothetical protein